MNGPIDIALHKADSAMQWALKCERYEQRYRDAGIRSHARHWRELAIQARADAAEHFRHAETLAAELE